MALPAERTQQVVARAPRLAGAVAGRVGGEAAGIWRDARALSRRPMLAKDGMGMPSSGQVYFAWYAGVATMALLRVIEWRIAAVLAAMHTVERYGHRRRLQEFLEGVDAGGI